MEEPLIKTEIRDRIAILTLNDPGRLNAMSEAMSIQFKESILALGCDDRVKVLVLTGQGRAFCAGGRLDEIAANFRVDPGVLKKRSFEFYNNFLSIRTLKIPTIAAVNGMAVGAGACLALACDMRVASGKAEFRFSFARLGLHPGMGAEFLLQRAVGEAKTFELLLTGDTVPAEEARTMGLVNQVALPNALMDQTLDLAAKVCAMPDLPVKMMKDSIPAARNSSLTETLLRQASYQAINYMTDDFKEGITALQERRPPCFKDRGY